MKVIIPSFWKCNFPINQNVCLIVVCLSVGLSVQKKFVRIFGKCIVFFHFLKTPPLPDINVNLIWNYLLVLFWLT